MPTQPQPAINNVILYARSARNENDGAVERQLTTGRAWSTAWGGKVLDAYHEYGSANGPCPELQRAIQAAQAQGAALVCARQDRMARDITLYFARLDDCRQRGVPVYFADRPWPQDETTRLPDLMKHLYEKSLGRPLRRVLPKRLNAAAPKTAWIYSRTRAKVPEAAPSPQLRRCEAYCFLHNLTVAGQSADVGSFQARQRRPGLEQALAAAQSRAFDVLVVDTVDRLPHQLDHFLEILETFQRAGVEVRFWDQSRASLLDYLSNWQHEARKKQARRPKQRPANRCPKNDRTPPPQSPDAEAQ